MAVTSKSVKSNSLTQPKTIHYPTKTPSINSEISFLTSIKNPLNPKVNANPNPNLNAKTKTITITKNQPSKPFPPSPLSLKIRRKYKPTNQNLPKYTLSLH